MLAPATSSLHTMSEGLFDMPRPGQPLMLQNMTERVEREVGGGDRDGEDM